MAKLRPDSAAHHERLNSSEPLVKLSSDRNFGLVFTAAFALTWILPVRRGGEPRWWALGVSVLFLTLAFGAPKVLHPLNLLWAKLAVVLNMVVSPIVMGVLFVLAFGTMGWLLRAMGKDLLRLRREPGAASYWIPRVPPGPDPATMVRQF